MTDICINNAQQIPIIDGELHYLPGFFTPPAGEAYLTQLIQTTPWGRRILKLYGKTCLMPRLIAWYADPGVHYRYSNGDSPRHAWTGILQEIKTQVETHAHSNFNGVLLNYYRDGQDSMAWHSDDEVSLGAQPLIASVSFGATRRFLLRHKFDSACNKIELHLTHGSLLLMSGATQNYWQHCLPKCKYTQQPRINLTFRNTLI